MTRMFVVVLFMLSGSFTRPSPVHAQPAPPCPPDATPVVPVIVSNISVDDLLQPLVASLRDQSPTFRRQWEAIEASRIVRVKVVARMGMQDERSARARTQVARYAYGSVRATIEVPPTAELTELLAHELEHVIEQLEGLDLPDLARRGQRGVVEVGNGVYETARARAVGRQVLKERYGETDQALDAALDGVKRFWRAITPSSSRGGSPPGDPAAVRRRPTPVRRPPPRAGRS